MTPSAIQHLSPWESTLPQASLGNTGFERARADVAVLGAGVVGLTTALLLQREGRRVVVVEAGRLGHGVTTQATVKATVGHGIRYSAIESKLGHTAAAAYAAANVSGLLTLLELVDELSIDCDLQLCPHVVYAEDDETADKVRREAAVVADLGMSASLTDDVPLPFPTTAALAFEGQAQLHPGAYLVGLAEAFVGAGGRIIESCPSSGVHEASPCTVTTELGDITADDVVVATHVPILDRGGHFTRLKAHRSYGVALVLPVGVPAGMTIGAAPGGFSTRTAELDGEHLLIVVGAGHPVGHVSDTATRWATLESWADQRFGASDVRYRWSTQDVSSLDDVPYAGYLTPGSEHVLTATGFGGWGMTNGTASALLLRDLLLGRENLWAETYDARRLGLPGTAPAFIRQNAEVAKLWVKGRVVGAHRGTYDDVQPGEAAVLEIDGDQTAVCRDDDGTLHAVSAVCTHLGCTVAWNDGERSWDCPCHGSRFSPDGEVLHGPAVAPLAPRRPSG